MASAATDDLIKVEVWDVTDASEEEAKSNLGVYKGETDRVERETFIDNEDKTTGAHAVILMIDPTRKWTMDYARTLLSVAPKDLPVLLVVRLRVTVVE